ncbi:MAG: hypothetical protein A2Y07_02595 [Planctomycetes bacterium GWF2_50_10]|nr:MAG: hypothetical protein A2Y07_02595 [Planctomycetes bacterium GWF2_50_10]
MKRSIALFFVGLFLPAAADACLVGITISASDGTNTASRNFAAEITGEGLQRVSLVDQDIVLFDDAAIEGLAIRLDEDPEVGIEFAVRAGNSETTFTITSEVLEFDALTNPSAYASAGVTLSDRTPTNGAAITGLFDGGKMHQAKYNGSIVWANLVGSFAVTNNTLTISESRPASGDEIINDTLTSIESQFKFKLSAKDAAAGTSTFAVIPEPATMALLGLGGIGFLRRKLN